MPFDAATLAAELAAQAAAEPIYPPDRFEGRGIVICAGGARMFTCAWVCIGLLRRHLGCALPIEVWHLGPEELGPPMRGLLEELGVQTVDALEVAKRHAVSRLGGWELKSYALLHSRFREVLLIDADNVPIRDPSYLFDRPEFQETGALFWPDLVRLSPENPIWTITGLAPFPSASFESGQIVLDKQRCWRALTLANWMNQHSDAFYDLLHGDKDTFLIAWLLLNQPFHLIRHSVKQLDATLCQRDPDGRLLFQHRNGAKWILSGVNPRIEGFRLENECLALLAELAERWDGGIFNPPPRSQAAQDLEQCLAQTRRFLFVRVSSDEQPVELLPDHRLTGAPRSREAYWYVGDGADGFELTLADSHHRSAVLHEGEDGIWRGQTLYEMRLQVELIPVTPADNHSATDRPAPSSLQLSALLDRALLAFSALPSDAEVQRDWVGFIRTLATLEPSLSDRLRDEAGRWPESSARARVVRLALSGLAAPRDAGRPGAVERGNNWNSHVYPATGYEPVA